MITEEKLLKLRKLADAMYYAAQHLTTDASGLHKAMDEYHKFIVNEYHKEEPVSEDFKIALEKKVREAQDWTYIEEEGGECPLNEEFGAYDLEEFAMWGANWQEQQIKNRAIWCEAHPEDDEIWGCFDIYNLRDGEKVKVIVIKEE